MKRVTSSSRWMTGVGVVGVGVLVATLGIGLTSALAADEKADKRTVKLSAQPAAQEAVASVAGAEATVAGTAARRTADRAVTATEKKAVATQKSFAEKQAQAEKQALAGKRAPHAAKRTTATKAPAAKAPSTKAPSTKAPSTKAPATKAPTPVPTNSQSPLQRLEALARDVARPSGGTVTVTGRDENVPSVDVLVATTDGRFFRLTVRYYDDPDGVETARQQCRNDHQHPEDGRVCTTLLSKPDLIVWSRDYTTQPGRQTMTLAAKTEYSSLWVKFHNDVETPDGSKELGPGWKDAGITVSGLRKAVVRSGLTVVKS